MTNCLQFPLSFMLIAILAALLIGVAMKCMQKHLKTVRRTTLRSFSIVDLEFMAKHEDFDKTIRGIFYLDDSEQKKVLQKLKSILWLDFLFMPAAFGSIFFISMCVACRSESGSFGAQFFAFSAWLVALPWLLDIFENLVMLWRVKEIEHSHASGQELKTESFKKLYRWYTAAVWLKWLLASVILGMALFTAFYLLISG